MLFECGRSNQIEFSYCKVDLIDKAICNGRAFFAPLSVPLL